MEILNYAVQQDFYEFYIGNGGISLECDYKKNTFTLVRKISDDESFYYSYPDEESAKNDWKILSKLKHSDNDFKK